MAVVEQALMDEPVASANASAVLADVRAASFRMRAGVQVVVCGASSCHLPSPHGNVTLSLTCPQSSPGKPTHMHAHAWGQSSTKCAARLRKRQIRHP